MERAETLLQLRSILYYEGTKGLVDACEKRKYKLSEFVKALDHAIVLEENNDFTIPFK